MLRRGCISQIATRESTSPKTIRRIWQQGKASELENFVADVNCKFPKRVGRKRIQIDFNEVSKIPFHRLTNIRSMADVMNVAKSTLHRRIKEGAIRPHSNALKPYLSMENKKARLQFCLSILEPNSLNNNQFLKVCSIMSMSMKSGFTCPRNQKSIIFSLENKSLYILVKANGLLPT